MKHIKITMCISTLVFSVNTSVFSAPGCRQVAFKTTFTVPPIAVSTKVSRFGGDGGWLRSCHLDSTSIGLTVDEDQTRDSERSHAAENAGIIIFSHPFDVRFESSSDTVWRMEASTVRLPSTTAGNTSFTQVNFRQTYSVVPNVFLLAGPEGDDPSAVRMRNATTTGFQVVQVEPPGEDGPHEEMTIHYLAVEPGQHQLPNGLKIETGSINTQKVQHGAGVAGAEDWDVITYTTRFAYNPVVLAQIQSMQNENGSPPGSPSSPWLTLSAQANSRLSLKLALERSEVNVGNVTLAEKIAYFAIQSCAGGSFYDNSSTLVSYETIYTQSMFTGWDD